MQASQIDSALPSEIYYDPKLRRYRYSGGEGKPQRGTFVSRKDVLIMQKKHLIEAQKKLIELTPRIKQGEISAYIEAGHLLKSIHLSNAVISAGGFDKLTNKDLGTIGSILKKQYYAGIGEDGKKYGLKHLFKEVKNNEISENQLKYRLSLYSKSGLSTGYVISQNHALSDGYTVMKRIDSKDDRECDDCIRYGKMGWQLIGNLPLPTHECKCRTNCRCRVIYEKLENVVLGA